jgi:hypothetical protein
MMAVGATITGKLSESARQVLERYLWEVRLSLQGCRSVNVAEVEADVRQHIDQELSDAAQPVSPEQLSIVLHKLGSPRQWVPEEEMSWWRRALLKLRTGPHDIRLAAASLALLLLGLTFPSLTWPFILGSFILARAMIAMVADQDRELGWQRWWIFPPLVLLYVPLAAALLSWPVLTAPVAAELSNDRLISPFNGQPWRVLPSAPLILASTAAALSVWWMIASIVLLAWPRILKHVFRPFVGGIPRIRSALLLLTSGVFFAVSGTNLHQIIRANYPMTPSPPALQRTLHR